MLAPLTHWLLRYIYHEARQLRLLWGTTLYQNRLWKGVILLALVNKSFNQWEKGWKKDIYGAGGFSLAIGWLDDACFLSSLSLLLCYCDELIIIIIWSCCLLLLLSLSIKLWLVIIFVICVIWITTMAITKNMTTRMGWGKGGGGWGWWWWCWWWWLWLWFWPHGPSRYHSFNRQLELHKITMEKEDFWAACKCGVDMNRKALRKRFI